MNTSNNQIYIFDTTLRDGEQSPGASLNELEKIKIAHALSRLNVDIIEAGFPYSSEGDFSAVKRIANEVIGPVICGLARASNRDIERAGDALESAIKRNAGRIHTFISTSDIHLEYKLKMSKDDALKKAVQAVQLAKSITPDVEFSPEDAGRTDEKYLYDILTATIEAGATTVNIPDTVGYKTPDEYGQLIHRIKANVKNIDQAIVSVHCHDDLGLAVANSLSGIMNGARQVECTINGIGERAGNCSLEEIVMILQTRKELLDLYTNIESTEILKTSQLVSSLTGFAIQKNKAIVGSNAFAHESGIHQDGMLKNKETYEIIDPVTIGLKSNNLSLGPRSGKHALQQKLLELGHTFNEDDLNNIYKSFKNIADKKKQVTDRDLMSIINESDRDRMSEQHYSLDTLQVISGTGLPTASIKIINNKSQTTHITTALGTGPIDAIYNAIQDTVQQPIELLEYLVHSVTEGIDAQGWVSVRISYKNKIYNGQGVDTDVLTASAKAYINAMNKIIF